MSIEEAVAKDLVAILFVTFTFGGTVLCLIVSTIAENWRKVRIAEKQVGIKQSMLDRGYRADEIAKVVNSGGGDG